MNRRASEIAQEFLRSTDVQQRRNALVFLAAIASPDAIRLLVRCAAGPDTAIREAATGEILRLDTSGRNVAVEALHALAADPDQELRDRVYAVLGRLGSLLHADQGLGYRVRRAWRLHRQIYPSKSLLFYARTIPWTLLGWLLAGIALLVYLSWIEVLPRFENSVAPFGLVLLGAFAALLFAPTATWRTAPFHLHADRIVGGIMECLFPLAAVVPALAILWIVTVLRNDPSAPSEELQLIPFLCVALILALTFVASRLGTLGASRIAPARPLRFLIAFLCGGMLGTLTLSATMLVAPRTSLQLYWPVIVLAVFGVAAAFASIDRTINVAAPAFRPRSAVFAIVIAVAFGIMAAAPINRVTETPSLGAPVGLEIAQLPYDISFRVTSPERVVVSVENRMDMNLAVGLYNNVGKEVPQGYGSQPPVVDVTLPRGLYTARIADNEPDLPEGGYGVEMETVFQTLVDLAKSQLAEPKREASKPVNPPLRGVLIAMRDLREATYRQIDAVPLEADTQVEVPSTPHLSYMRASVGQTFRIEVREPVPLKEQLIPMVFSAEGRPIAAISADDTFEVGKGDYVVVVAPENSPKVASLRINRNETKVTAPEPVVPGVEWRVKLAREVFFSPAEGTSIGQGFSSIARSVDVLPYVHFLDVRRTTTIQAVVSASTSTPDDIVVQLRNSRDEVLKRADDPEDLTETVAPGRYTIEVLRYRDRDSFKPLPAQDGGINLMAWPAQFELRLTVK